MILLYTGAAAPNTVQINADKSLGGYPSTTGAPNGRLANIFSGISKSDVQQNRSVIRMIALKNTTGAGVTNVKVYSNVAQGHVKLKLAAVASADDGKGNPLFEAVADGGSIPYQAELDYHEGVDNCIVVGDLAADQVIGIWILREPDATKFPELFTTATGQELATILENAQAQSTDDIKLIVEYN